MAAAGARVSGRGQDERLRLVEAQARRTVSSYVESKKPQDQSFAAFRNLSRDCAKTRKPARCGERLRMFS